MYSPTRTKKGFTLIELLVVIAIIGMLSSIVIASLNTARAKARDARRMQDITSVHTALELFYAANSRYPSATDGNCAHTNSFAPGGCLQVLVSGGYIPSLPVDPKSPAAGWQYYYDNWCMVGSAGNQSFRLWSEGEFSHNGLAGNWWNDNNIGRTTCQDPS